MIQRIQSVFLLLVAVLMGIAIVSPLMEFSDGGESAYTFISLGIGPLFSVKYSTTWGVFVFATLSALSAFVNIFLYKKRKMQTLVGYSTILFILLFYLAVYFYFNSYTTENALIFSSFGYGVILPIIALVFNLLAILRIKKDDNLVKSLNRIR